jgi:hypothetical protein
VLILIVTLLVFGGSASNCRMGDLTQPVVDIEGPTYRPPSAAISVF